VTEELINHDAVALGELVRKGEISPVELLDATIQNIEKLNPKLNAVVHKTYDQAHETALNWSTRLVKDQAEEAIFCGVPFLLKNLLAEYKGTPFGDGSRAVHGYISELDTELVKRQKASGLNIVGKTNASEFGTFVSTKAEPGKMLDVASSFNPFTRIQNLTGQPAMSVPLFWTGDNVPIGVHFAGRFGDEPTLFRLAAQLEQARPWLNRKPPVHCSFE
jgi:Asp-tRNA(Asn)/Glu-tRNA(Gln) amidotransferase A subunit family amidase